MPGRLNLVQVSASLAVKSLPTEPQGIPLLFALELGQAIQNYITVTYITVMRAVGEVGCTATASY